MLHSAEHKCVIWFIILRACLCHYKSPNNMVNTPFQEPPSRQYYRCKRYPSYSQDAKPRLLVLNPCGCGRHTLQRLWQQMHCKDRRQGLITGWCVLKTMRGHAWKNDWTIIQVNHNLGATLRGLQIKCEWDPKYWVCLLSNAKIKSTEIHCTWQTHTTQERVIWWRGW